MNSKSLLEQLLQSGQQMASRGRDIAEQKLNVPASGPERDSMLSGLGKGALAGGLLSMLLGSRGGRRLGGSALKVGGLVALGGLALNAYRNYKAGQGTQTAAANAEPPAGFGKPIGQLEDRSADERSLNLVRAMIAAAKADGHVDDDERAKLKQQIERFGLSQADLAALQAELDRPLDPAAIAATADSPAAAAELYLASLLVIDVDNPMERAYLQSLATALELPADLVRQIEDEVGVRGGGR